MKSPIIGDYYLHILVRIIIKMLIAVDKQNRNNYERVEKDFKLAFNLLVSFGIGGLRKVGLLPSDAVKKQQQRYP